MYLKFVTSWSVTGNIERDTYKENGKEERKGEKEGRRE